MAICEKCLEEVIEFAKNGKFLAYCLACGHWTFFGSEHIYQNQKNLEFIPDFDDLLDITSDINIQRDLTEEIPDFDDKSEEVPIDENDSHNVGFRYPDAPELDREQDGMSSVERF